MTITHEQFEEIFGPVKNSEELVEKLNEILPRYDINTKDRVCAFLAQCGHESGNFSLTVENLNYSAEGLLKIFGKYFTKETAPQYARKPEKIANRVYANRMGNGDEASGDGWKFRGRGYIQLTGKDNYITCGNSIGTDLLESPEYLTSVEGAVVSACWFWDKNNLNPIADRCEMKTLTKRINGGFNGLDHRMELYQKAQAVL